MQMKINTYICMPIGKYCPNICYKLKTGSKTKVRLGWKIMEERNFI